jgi:DNA-binding Xre family transcriptional regulator
MKERPRRSAGMRGDPRTAVSEHQPISSAPPKPRPESSSPERVSTSPYAKPKILMGEVAAPRGVQIGKQRDAFRAFMISRRLRPTLWALAAGVPSGEILAFLTGKVRAIAPATLEKLARAANCAPEDMFG